MNKSLKESEREAQPSMKDGDSAENAKRQRQWRDDRFGTDHPGRHSSASRRVVADDIITRYVARASTDTIYGRKALLKRGPVCGGCCGTHPRAAFHGLLVSDALAP